MNRRRFLAGAGVLTGLAGLSGWRIRRRLEAGAPGRLRAVRVQEVPTAPAGEALDFLAVGDTGKDSDVRRAVVEAMRVDVEQRPADFVALLGDNVYPHGVESVEDPAWSVHFEEAFAPLRPLPFFPCLGNHDHQGRPEAQVEYSRSHPAWNLPAAYHSFRRSASASLAARFFVLDTTPLRLEPFDVFERPPQAAWLEEHLAAATEPWRIAFGHHPLFSGGTRGGSSKLLWKLGPVFAEQGLDLYFSGHNHDLELLDPGRGWLQVVSGAGAAPRPVHATEDTLFSREGGGFVRASLRADAAWLAFHGLDAEPTYFKIERRATTLAGGASGVGEGATGPRRSG